MPTPPAPSAAALRYLRAVLQILQLSALACGAVWLWLVLTGRLAVLDGASVALFWGSFGALVGFVWLRRRWRCSSCGASLGLVHAMPKFCRSCGQAVASHDPRDDP